MSAPRDADANRGSALHDRRRGEAADNIADRGEIDSRSSSSNGALLLEPRETHELAALCPALVMNTIMCWNTRYEMTLLAIIDRLEREDRPVGRIAREHISAARFAQINQHGRYHFRRRGPGDSREREPSPGSGVVLRVPSPRLATDGEPPSCLLAIPVGHAAVREHSTLKAAVK